MLRSYTGADVVRVPLEGRAAPLVRFFDEEGRPSVVRAQVVSVFLAPRGVGVARALGALERVAAEQFAASTAQAGFLRDVGLLAARANCVSLVAAPGAAAWLAALLGADSATARAFRAAAADAPRRAQPAARASPGPARDRRLKNTTALTLSPPPPPRPLPLAARRRPAWRSSGGN
jgi:hypothetical protein